jgi:transcriptional regulator with XRE-family HTH domain
MTLDDEYDIEPTEEHLPKSRTITLSGDAFADFILQRRLELGLSLVQLEERTGIHNSRLSRWERGLEAPARTERLTALAIGLGVPPADLYLLAGIELDPELPSMRPYLRSKYGPELPASAIAEIEAYSARVAARYGVSTGPAPGEDE